MQLEAIIHSLKIWWHYLVGNKFPLLTDNIGLKYVLDKKTLNVYQAKWNVFLSEYDFKIKHIKGNENIIADTLSWKLDKMYSILISDYESEFKNLLKEASNNDKQYTSWVEKCNQEIFRIEESLYQIDTEWFLRFKNWIYVPNQNNIKQTIFR